MEEENKAGERLFLSTLSVIMSSAAIVLSLGVLFTGAFAASYHLMFYHYRYDENPPRKFKHFKDLIKEKMRLHVPYTFVLGVSLAILLMGFMASSAVWHYVVVYFFLFEVTLISAVAFSVIAAIELPNLGEVIKHSVIIAHVQSAAALLNVLLIFLIGLVYQYVSLGVYIGLFPVMVIAYIFLTAPVLYKALSPYMEH